MAPIKIAAHGRDMRWRNYFDGTILLLAKVRRYLVAFSYPDYSKLNSNWNTCTNPRTGHSRPKSPTFLGYVVLKLGAQSHWLDAN